MSRYPHRALAERNKRVQMQNCIEDKFLKQKLDSISREKLYIDRELRRISLAKESLMESLDRCTAPPRVAGKRLSLPCVIDGRRKDSNMRRHTFDSVRGLHTEAERNHKLKPLSCVCDPIPDRGEGIPRSPRGKLTSHLEQLGSALGTTSLDYQQDALEIRVASPVTASSIQSSENRFTNERPGLYSRQTCVYETPLHLPRLPASSRETRAESSDPAKDLLGTGKPARWSACDKPEKQVPPDWVGCHGDRDFTGSTWQEERKDRERPVASFSTKSTLHPSNHLVYHFNQIAVEVRK